MGVIVTFSYPVWIAQFPFFAGVAQSDVIQTYFDPSSQQTLTLGYLGLAQLYVRNDGGGPVSNPNIQLNLLNLAVCHIAFINSPQTNGVPTTGGLEPAPGVVGRISTATEGSVTVNAELPQPPSGTAAWWNQTQWGAQAYQLMAAYRTMRYLPGRVRNFGPYGYPGFGSGNPWGQGPW